MAGALEAVCRRNADHAGAGRCIRMGMAGDEPTRRRCSLPPRSPRCPLCPAEAKNGGIILVY